MKNQPHRWILHRRRYLRLIADLLGSGGAVGIWGPSVIRAIEPIEASRPLDPSYLEKGLTGMARAKGWFNAHFGAAVLAGYYLCQDNGLPAELKLAIQSELDWMIESRSSQFTPFSRGAGGRVSVEPIHSTLVKAMEGGLRAHGHAVIYAALALRALRDSPELLIPQIVVPLCEHLSTIAKLAPKRPAEKDGYEQPKEIVESLAGTVNRFSPLLGRPEVRRPNFTHMVTHTDALMTLHELGHEDLFRIGQLAHLAHMEVVVPSIDQSADPVPSNPVENVDPWKEAFWKDMDNQNRWRRDWDESSNPNGSWFAFGHLFKLLYAYRRVAQHLEDARSTTVMTQVVFERLVNPEVRGG